MADTVCKHVFDDPRRDVCTRCGLTGSAIAAGRDRSASWDDVDAAFVRGFTDATEWAKLSRRADRRHGFKVGARWVLRELRSREEARGG